MTENLLIPAIVHFNLGSSKVNITDYHIAIALENGSQYVRSINAQGKAVYAIRKGGEIGQATDIKVSVLKTPDKKFDDDIKKLEKALEVTKENDPKKYVENMLFSIATNDDKPFTHIQFQGYVSEMSSEVDAETGLQEVTAELAVYDPVSFVIKK
ncbi:hypothetical protein [Cardinium endosymbiont of Oedothorax gibbosus]|uniref:hypothetical protein n=1 Tax=Cardinium endosymbiont of Oedothorax gibbosus TaxID=931101 RepID=UPI002023E52B|nr:hypothetical protein [Cardinium endosymbiont of Oedothorax gibbosus]CAH2559992.1 Putative Afp-like phage protein [Cardinium endosymbiont of Oedothorax gibbosus]